MAVKTQTMDFMERVNFVDEIGRENFFDSKSEAIRDVYEAP